MLVTLQRTVRAFGEWCSKAARHRTQSDIDAAAPDTAPAEAPRNPWSDVLLPKRLGRADIDPAYLVAAEPAVMRDLKRACADCTSADRCRREIDDEGAELEYCPNAATIDNLVLEKYIGERH